MILDRLDNCDAYRSLSPRIARALDYLRTQDFAGLTPGKYELEGEELFAMVQRYTSRPMSQIVWESHRRYIDVQYVAQGREWMGYAPLREDVMASEAYDASKDAAFYALKGDLFDCRAGTVAIFTPQDIHAPGLAAGEPGPVIKVVVKVAVNPAGGPSGF